MNKKILFAAFAAAATLTFSACSNDEDAAATANSSAQQGQIGFTASWNNKLAGSTGTRATAITSSNYLDNDLVPSMKVWGYFTADATEGDGVTQGGEYVKGIIIDNKSTNSSVWEYNNTADQAYWPTQPLNFYAIIPSSDDCMTVNTAVGGSKIAHVTADVVVPTDNSKQKDILFAKSLNQTRTASSNTPVDFTFDHAMTQVAFSGKCAAEKLSVDIESVTIANADQSGTVGFTTDNTLGYALATTRTYAKYSIGLADDATLSGTANKETAKNITAEDGVLMMLPQADGTKWATTPASAVSVATADNQHQTYLAVSCKIKNGEDVYILGGASSYQTVYIPFEINWEQGKKYTYTLIFGAGSGGYDEDGNPLNSMLPITYTVSSVTDWVAVDGGEVSF